jgi:hypothetical protein
MAARVSRKPSLPGNRDFAWDKFDPEAYVSHYYADPHPDDDRVVSLASRALRLARPADASITVLDVGTGPNLFPLLAALPRGGALTAWEYSDSNIAWLAAELKRKELRPCWRHFWQVVREAYGADYPFPADPAAALRSRLEIRKGSIFDLPERTWDAATMFFCAESITRRHEEFDQACACFSRAVRPGGTLAGAFLLRSESYEVAGLRYPAMALSVDLLRETFSRIADAVTIERIGIVEHEVRSGYTGMAFLTARSR